MRPKQVSAGSPLQSLQFGVNRSCSGEEMQQRQICKELLEDKAACLQSRPCHEGAAACHRVLTRRHKDSYRPSMTSGHPRVCPMALGYGLPPCGNNARHDIIHLTCIDMTRLLESLLGSLMMSPSPSRVDHDARHTASALNSHHPLIILMSTSAGRLLVPS